MRAADMIYIELCFIGALNRAGTCAGSPTQQQRETDVAVMSAPLEISVVCGAWAARHLTLINLFALTKAARKSTIKVACR
jgi:hypothetical protein